MASVLASCSLSTGDAEGDDEVLELATHDSFVLSDGILDEFEEENGVRVEVRPSGDAGELASQLALTKDDPVADVAFGIDDAFASRVADEGVFEPYRSPAAAGGSEDFALGGAVGEDELTAVDHGAVCLNYDEDWFDAHGVEPPSSMADLTSPEYRDRTVVESPATSSPGLAFLLATVDRFGDGPPEDTTGGEDAPSDDGGWQGFWHELKDNGVSVADSWTQAYSVEFSGSAGEGPRPIAVSYATSPAAETGDDGAPPGTRIVEDSCFRQVEYAGVLEGADNPEAARALVDFLLSDRVQEDLPEQMYVMPVQRDTPLPEDFAEHAPEPEHPATMDPEEIGDHRDDWIRQWRSIVVG